MLRTFYRGKLPHIMPIGATFFITFHLYGAIPKPVLKKLKDEFDLKILELEHSNLLNKEELIYREQKLFFKKYDDYLDLQKSAVKHLKNREVATIIKEQVFRFEKEWYETLAFTAMPNHCHWVADFSVQLKNTPRYSPVTEEVYKQLDKVMHRVKGPSSRYSNQLLGLKGQFWYHESYDHFVRNDKELFNTVRYTILNPQKAGLVEHWRDWEGTYLHADWVDKFP